MKTYRFKINISCSLHSDSVHNKEIYEDNGFIILPDSYSDNGAPTRLVISCHGAGGTVTTDDSQIEHQALTQYLVANGYAVMDVNGLPEAYAAKNGIDLRNNIGSPIAVACYVEGYRYCMAHFNLLSEVFVHGASMGGISSTNLVLHGNIPVIAHSAFCPVLDTYNEIFLHPWSGGLPKTALGKIYQLDTDESGEYIYDESKMLGYNPAKNTKVENYPVPLKFWHCLDDPVVSYDVTKKFVERITKNGGVAYLRAFEKGGHEPQLVGEAIDKPLGNTRLSDINIKILPAVEEVFAWIKAFD